MEFPTTTNANNTKYTTGTSITTDTTGNTDTKYTTGTSITTDTVDNVDYYCACGFAINSSNIDTRKVTPNDTLINDDLVMSKVTDKVIDLLIEKITDKVGDCYAAIQKNNSVIELGVSVNADMFYELKEQMIIKSCTIADIESVSGKINGKCDDTIDRLEKLLTAFQLSATNNESALYSMMINLENAEKRNEHRHKEAMALSRAIYKIIAPNVD